MTDISQIGPAARVVVTQSPGARKAPAPTPAAAPRDQVPRLPGNARVEVEATETADAPEPLGGTASTTSSAVEPLSPTGPTRVTAYSDESSGRYVIQVREAESNDVINQYPPKELLRFYAAAREALEQAIERSAKAKDVNA